MHVYYFVKNVIFFFLLLKTRFNKSHILKKKKTKCFLEYEQFGNCIFVFSNFSPLELIK